MASPQESFGNLSVAWNDQKYIPLTAAEYRSEKRVTDDDGHDADWWLREAA